jgi:cell shape-determining protein MreD
VTGGRVLTLILATWIGLILVACGQAVLPVSWPVRLPGPDVALLVILYVGLTSQPSPSLGSLGGGAGVCALALLLGWMADLGGGAPKGLHMAAYALAGLAARGASSRILVRGFLLTALTAFTFALAAGLFVVGLRTSLAPPLGWGGIRQVPTSALTTALFAPIVFRILARLDRRWTRDPRLLGAAGGEGRLR